MTRRLPILIMTSMVLVVFASCHRKATRNRLNEIQFPPIMLWAWERPEDLSFIDPRTCGVAFLAQTLILRGDDVGLNPRQQPLRLPPEAKVMAVTRIESQKTTSQRPALSQNQREKLVKLILQTLEPGQVSAIQIDFDAQVSEREFYRALLQDLRAQLPDTVPLSMTALASFCMGDRWLNELPVDEAVPMIFRMGADDKSIKSMLANGNDFGEPLCRRSYGIAVDEPVEMKFAKTRRIYVFNDRSWSKDDFASVQQRMSVAP